MCMFMLPSTPTSYQTDIIPPPREYRASRAILMANKSHHNRHQCFFVVVDPCSCCQPPGAERDAATAIIQ